jgi:hypothetical protein
VLAYCYLSKWKAPNSKPERKVDSLPLLGLYPVTFSTPTYHFVYAAKSPPPNHLHKEKCTHRVENTVQKKFLKIQSENEKISESISIQKKNLPNFL